MRANQSDRCPPYLSCRVSAPAAVSLAVVDISIILADCPLDDYHVLTACLTVSASDGLRLFSSVTETDPPPPPPPPSPSSCSANANTLYRRFPDPPPFRPPTSVALAVAIAPIVAPLPACPLARLRRLACIDHLAVSLIPLDTVWER